MYCRNCGSSVNSVHSICPTCGFLPLNGKSFCQECGYQTQKNDEVCVSCGKTLKYATISYSNQKKNEHQQNTNHTYQTNFNQRAYQNNYNNYNNNDVDEPNTLANVGACCSIPFTGGLPIVGLILYLVWKDEKPNAAQSVCMWSLIPFIFIAIFYVLVFVSYAAGMFINL